jgi:hypothetical protein
MLSFCILVNLLMPKVSIGATPLEKPKVMFVPEATMYEHGDSARRKYKVGTAL